MKVYIGPYPGLRSKKERRVSIRIDNYDVWNMDATLALLICPMLKRLKETKHGIPSSLVEYEEDGFTEKPGAFDEGVRKWDEILDKMIYSFEAVLNDYNSDNYHLPIPDGESDHVIQYDVVDDDDLTKTIKTEQFRMRTRYDPILHKEEIDKIREGLELFGKHYMNLWD